MPAFVFPGQGSQRPGMGRPWTDHPSWEVVADASETAGRDIGRLLLDASLDELTETRNAQLATFTFSLLVIDAIERLGHRADGVRRPLRRRVHRPGRQRGPRLRGRRAGRGRAG